MASSALKPLHCCRDFALHFQACGAQVFKSELRYSLEVWAEIQRSMCAQQQPDTPLLQRACCPVPGGACHVSTDCSSSLPRGQNRCLWVAVSFTHCHQDGVTPPHTEQCQQQLSVQDNDPHRHRIRADCWLQPPETIVWVLGNGLLVLLSLYICIQSASFSIMQQGTNS